LKTDGTVLLFGQSSIHPVKQIQRVKTRNVDQITIEFPNSKIFVGSEKVQLPQKQATPLQISTPKPVYSELLSEDKCQAKILQYLILSD
jgi:hypothetical protein